MIPSQRSPRERGLFRGGDDNVDAQDLDIVNDSNGLANPLFHNPRMGHFLDVALGSGADAIATSGAGIDPTAVDHDNDGTLDLFVTNGRDTIPSRTGRTRVRFSLPWDRFPAPVGAVGAQGVPP